MGEITYGRRSPMNAPRVGITGAAYALPAAEVTTAALQDRVSGRALPPGMFERATGIARRRLALPGWQSLTVRAGSCE
jgi:3-oxoacyl-[acyl-carrier-protein] synthase-3